MYLYERSSSKDSAVIHRTVLVGSDLYLNTNDAIRTLKVSWHPYGDTHLGILYSDSVFSDRVAVGRALDLPVYFGDAGSREVKLISIHTTENHMMWNHSVLHKIGAERACAAAITLDTPGANYRTVWALSKYFPNVKTFVRAHDVDHGLNLEKAGVAAVVPETLEPSLQLASVVLAHAKLPMSEIAATINEFRSCHLSELTEPLLCDPNPNSPANSEVARLTTTSSSIG
ncbi:K(+) efflux antiporter 2, chloroplastic-like isoform X2 [Helianthus annuus]|uniref:K(+) efflux antiporter 2, chloroplastic-like isoform X2 n=1 Tax=Helianthus annuus TaxID=4232 RepID=UPI001652FFB5|nr:K(+) efflux antiporter 2, chloroplastic-like isoform X2 [Helianthus annuus]XP_035845739.1 K(+) efflux antiporter 2, chloroplastic-like isoform X2 [Helianthus annuus]